MTNGFKFMHSNFVFHLEGSRGQNVNGFLKIYLKVQKDWKAFVYIGVRAKFLADGNSLHMLYSFGKENLSKAKPNYYIYITWCISQQINNKYSFFPYATQAR